MKEFLTFTDLESSRQNKTGQAFICQERANAKYILQPSGYTALPGDVTFANGRVGALQIDGKASVKWFGAKLDGLTNDLQAFNDAFSRCDYVIYDDSCLVSGTINMPERPSTLTSTSSENYITADFNGGPVVRMRWAGSSVFNCGIDATGVRLSSSFNKSNVGVLMDGVQATTPPLKGCSIHSNKIINQSGHGVYSAFISNDSEIKGNLISECRGHAIIIDDGADNGLSQQRNGIINVTGNISERCGGYGIALAPSGGSSVYRVSIDNLEVTDCAWNSTEMSITMSDQTYIWGQNVQVNLIALNNERFADTTLRNNGLVKYPSAAPSGAIIVPSQSKSLSFNAPRFLTLSRGVNVVSNVDGFEFNYPFNGTATVLDYNLRIGTGVILENHTIKTSRFLTSDAVVNDSSSPVKCIIDDSDVFVFGGVNEFVSGNVESVEINGGGIVLKSDFISLVGQGDVADSVSFVNDTSNETYPLEDGKVLRFINENAYNITIQNGTDFITRSGASIAISTGQTASFIKAGGLYYEL